MRRSEARRNILLLWAIWSHPEKEDRTGPVHFFYWVEKQHPELLKFRVQGDRYKTIVDWVTKRTPAYDEDDL
ncbi:MAG: hypothetical protein AAFX00_08320 [Pseudomonadota bacterium]